MWYMTCSDMFLHPVLWLKSVNIANSIQRKSLSVNIMNNISLRIKSQAITSNKEWQTCQLTQQWSWELCWKAVISEPCKYLTGGVWGFYHHSEWKMLFWSLCWLAPGNVACGINVDVSLHPLRAQWLMRNSLTVKQQCKQISSNLICKSQGLYFSLPLFLPTFSHFHLCSLHTLFTFILIPIFLLPSKQIREQMRREEWYGWWGMPECQHMTSSTDGGREKRRKREGMWWKAKSIPQKPRLEKKWLMRPDVKLLLAWIIAFPMTKQKLPPYFPKHRHSRQITSKTVDNRDKSSTFLPWGTFSLPGQDSKSTKCFKLLLYADITLFRSIPLWKKHSLLNRYT